MKKTWLINNKVQFAEFAIESGKWKIDKPIEITVRHLDSRTSEQNRLLWAVLSALSEQVDWCGQKLSQEDWKNILTASLKKQRILPGIDGGFVVVSTSTSQMTKEEFSDLVDLSLAFAAQQGVEVPT